MTRPSHSSRTLELSKKDRGKRLYAEEKPKRIKSNNTGIDCSFHLVVLALHEQFGVREGCVMACMVKVEMRTNEQINLAGVQLSSKICSITVFPTIGAGNPGGSWTPLARPLSISTLVPLPVCW